MEGHTISSKVTYPCGSCKQEKLAIQLKAAIVDGVYYDRICNNCIGSQSNGISSAAAGFDRRRQYEDHAQDTVQPYVGERPNPEFYRLYPDAAEKVFKPDVIDDLKRKL